MAFWERNTLVLMAGSVLGGVFYFGVVVWQSVAIGAIAAPAWWVYVGYIVFQLCVSLFGTWLFNRNGDEDLTDLPKGDERDQVLRVGSEAVQGHVASALVIGCLLFWFVHQNVALFFHSIVAAMIISEIVRGFVQYHSYQRAI
ncbi:MAG: hypothetical protein AAGL97_04260 [Pseudomonadota bacterium]